MQATTTGADVSSHQLAEELVALWHHLMRGRAQAVFDIVDENDLSLTQMKTLTALAECRGVELSVKELADRLGLSLPGTSRTVDALLRRGWLERREDEHDRRMKRVAITAAGRDLVDRMSTARVQGVEQYTASLTPEQRSLLSAALADLPHNTP